MPFPYLIPSVTSLLPGYEAVVFTCRKQLADRIAKLPGTVLRRARAFSDAKQIFAQDDEITIGHRAIICSGIPPVRIAREASDPPGYIEVDYIEPNGEPIFKTNAVLSEYVVFSAPRMKSFFSDSAYKYASPANIDQVAKFGMFCEGYPVVVLDRDRGYGESVLIINPALQALTCNIRASGDRGVSKIKVGPMSSCLFDLASLLRDDERRWEGRIQIDSRSRVILFSVKHAWGNPTSISDHEHFDPFRSDPTHFPLAQLLRLRVGRYLKNRGIAFSS